MLLGSLQLAAIGLTLFRAVWISAVLVIITTFGLRRGRIGRSLFVTAVLGLLVVAVGSQLTQTQLFSERVDNTDNIWGRFAIYKQGIEIFRDEPLLGIGVSNYHAYAETISPEEVNGVEVGHVSTQHVHRAARRAGACRIRHAAPRVRRRVARPARPLTTAPDPRAQALLRVPAPGPPSGSS